MNFTTLKLTYGAPCGHFSKNVPKVDSLGRSSRYVVYKILKNYFIARYVLLLNSVPKIPKVDVIIHLQKVPTHSVIIQKLDPILYVFALK